MLIVNKFVKKICEYCLHCLNYNIKHNYYTV